MTRIVYVNGRYLPYAQAGVHVEDRGFQFADSVYEVCEVLDGAVIDLTRHLARLRRSLSELAIAEPMPASSLRHVLLEVVRRNRVRNGLVYLQVTRGQAPRDFLFPAPATKSTLVALARAIDPVKVAAKARSGISVISLPDPRWHRCDLKTTMLLPAALAKERARGEGAQEAWFVDETGYVTEGASSNAWIVRDGVVVTRPLDQRLLGGVTRATLLDLLQANAIPFEQRAFTIAEAQAADEAFVTSASATIMPVIRIDGRGVSAERPGTLTTRLRDTFHGFTELTLF